MNETVYGMGFVRIETWFKGRHLEISNKCKGTAKGFIEISLRFPGQTCLNTLLLEQAQKITTFGCNIVAWSFVNVKKFTQSGDFPFRTTKQRNVQ